MIYTLHVHRVTAMRSLHWYKQGDEWLGWSGVLHHPRTMTLEMLSPMLSPMLNETLSMMMYQLVGDQRAI